MRVWMYEMIYKEIEGVGSVHLDDLSDGVRRASVGNVRPGPMLVVRDRVGLAYMGRPFASLLVIRCLSLPVIWVLLGLAWGSGEPPACGGASVPVPVVW